MNDQRVPPVYFQAAPAHEIVIGDEQVSAVRRSAVPEPQVVENDRRHQPLDPSLVTELGHVIVLKVPGEADRRVQIADVQLVGIADDALGGAVAAGDDDVVAVTSSCSQASGISTL